MKTEKLYDNDSHLKEFKAAVLSCFKAESGYKIILDKTAFFPEGGGQPGDTGTLSDVRVLNTKEENGEIYHFTETPFEEGTEVTGKIDFARRFSFMQNHSGEHIVSGIVHRKYGFQNVSFHLNENFATLDFNGTLTREQLDEIEDEANGIVFSCVPVYTYYPTPEELKTIDYRSKKEISGDIRIVEIKGADVCACCAPHVKNTGEIGIIKLLDTVRMRGGTRITLKCGKYALADYRNKYFNVSAVADALSAKQEETFEAVKAQIKRADALTLCCSQLKHRLAEYIIKYADGGQVVFFEEDLDTKELQFLADGLHKTYGGIKAVFSGTDGALRFAMCAEDEKLKEVFERLKAAFPVKGGGRNGMVQGSVNTEFALITDFFKKEI